MSVSKVRWVLLGVVATAALAGGWLATTAADAKKSEFARGTIDLGVVVSDLDRAVKFYTEAIGFKEVPGFTVDADFCTAAGLTDHQALKIRVLVLDDDVSATRLKLMEVPGAKQEKRQRAHPFAAWLQLHHNLCGRRQCDALAAGQGGRAAAGQGTGAAAGRFDAGPGALRRARSRRQPDRTDRAGALSAARGMCDRLPALV